MLKNLRIKNYRMIKDLLIPNLGRVNLILGMNNSGKSSLLESLKIYASQGTQSALAKIVQDHNEVTFINEPNERFRRGVPRPQYENLFYNRRFMKRREGGAIYIGEDDKSDFIEIDHVYYEVVIDEVKGEKGEIFPYQRIKIIPKDIIKDHLRYSEALQISNEDSKQYYIYLSDEADEGLFRKMTSGRRGQLKPVSFIPTQFLSNESLANLWDDSIFRESSDKIREALKIIDPAFEDLAFIRSPKFRDGREREERIAVVKLSDYSKPIPLNSMGDGMLRVLQLILGVFPAERGFLLIDEFENGLHHSAQYSLWKIIFELAKKLRIQVFATTHSIDCITSFAKAAMESEEEGVLFRLGKSIRKDTLNQVIATVYREPDFHQILKSNMELR